MLKQLTQLEFKIGDRIYHLTCAPDSPITEIKDALFQFLKFVGQVEDSAKAQQEAQAQVKVEEEVKLEEV